jgi:hypothetical protein
MSKGFYHPDRGYWQTNTDPSEEVLNSYPDGTVEVELKPSVFHDMVDGVWVEWSQEKKDESLARHVRSERDRTLRVNVDTVVSNPLRWASMSAEEQQAWADYRQALLDIPDQEGFPHNVNWPTKPE